MKSLAVESRNKLMNTVFCLLQTPQELLDNEVPCRRMSKQMNQYRVLLVTDPTRIAR
jgi:hypothetical protein